MDTDAPLQNGSDWDVVIVGSGLSGLTAATRILEAKPDLHVLIVDAQDWFGGRTRSLHLDKYHSQVSVGGTFCLFEHHDTLDLAKQIGCYPGDSLSIKDVNFREFSPALFDPIGLPLFFKLMYKGSKVVQNGKILWGCKTAQKLDKISMEQWISEHWLLDKFNPDFTREFFYLLETYPNLNNVSALQCAIALWIRFRGIPRNGIEIPPKVLRWEGGTGVFTKALVGHLSANPNFQLELNSPVEQIIQPPLDAANTAEYPVQVVVNQKKTVTVNTKYVIVATAPLASAPAHQGGTIAYTPELKPETAQLLSSMIATPTVSYNILVIYKTPWWRAVGEGMFILPPYATHVTGTGVWGNVVEGTMQGDDMPGIVRVFCDSRRVEGWSEKAIKGSTIDFLKGLFPKHTDLVGDFEDIIIHNWNLAKPALPGVTYTYAPSGVLAQYGDYFTQPYGRIHWGGSERSVWGANWMEGAVERGNDVSEEVLKAAGWVSKDYNVRKAPATLRNVELASAADGLVSETSEDEDVESEPVEDFRQLPSPASPLGLAQTLQPKGAQLSFGELYAHLGTVQPPADVDKWISPQKCLDALKELEVKKLRKAVSSKSSSSSSSSSSSTVLPEVETPYPLHLAEGTTPFPPSLIEKPTPQTLTPQPVLARSEIFAKITVPSFAAGLALGVIVTAAAFRLGQHQ